MACFLGVDIGSTTTKLVLIEDEEILDRRVVSTGVNCEETAHQVLADILQDCGKERAEILRVVATGYGRRLISFADDVISEITANVKGTLHSCRDLDGGVRTISTLAVRTARLSLWTRTGSRETLP
ncbi:MAG: BadF/BadG/BcrA/BcrD ATPase family protein [Pseudomonadota bacterium]|nr:BadF/BadG/BcrA/BcrD ATPase family protein [Pseudomonadota bacterium]